MRRGSCLSGGLLAGQLDDAQAVRPCRPLDLAAATACGALGTRVEEAWRVPDLIRPGMGDSRPVVGRIPIRGGILGVGCLTTSIDQGGWFVSGRGGPQRHATTVDDERGFLLVILRAPRSP